MPSDPQPVHAGILPVGGPASRPQLVRYPGSEMLVPKRPKPGTGVTWRIREVARIVDGDTVHAWRQRWAVKAAEQLSDGIWGVTTQMVYDHPTPGVLRLIDLDT